MPEHSFVLDTNIWVSGIITNSVSRIEEYSSKNNLKIYICPEMIEELEDVLTRGKFKKYLSKPVVEYIEDVEKVCLKRKVEKRYNEAPDKDDNYLYDFCIDTESILVTGDKLLLKHLSDPLVETISKAKFFGLYL